LVIFTAIDVETANADMSSICQIGLATFEGEQIIDEWSTLVNPESYFSEINSRIHGITASDVADAQVYAEVYSTLQKKLVGQFIVTHTHYDRTSLNRANQMLAFPKFEVQWLDTARVARRAWTQFAKSGYGLANVCNHIGYSFKHHNALEDAKAAGQILLAACKEKNLSVEDWIFQIDQPASSGVARGHETIVRVGNPNGLLHGEVIVFTGTLQLARSEAADHAAKAGCEVAKGVTKKTTLLCVGDQDVARLAGHEKSSKHRKAEELIGNGQSIRIIRETDFLSMTKI